MDRSESWLISQISELRSKRDFSIRVCRELEDEARIQGFNLFGYPSYEEHRINISIAESQLPLLQRELARVQEAKSQTAQQPASPQNSSALFTPNRPGGLSNENSGHLSAGKERRIEEMSIAEERRKTKEAIETKINKLKRLYSDSEICAYACGHESQVKIAGIKRLSGDEYIRDVALSSNDGKVHTYAISRLSRDDYIRVVSTHSSDSEVKIAGIKRISRDDYIRDVALSSGDGKVHTYAVSRLSRDDYIREVKEHSMERKEIFEW